MNRISKTLTALTFSLITLASFSSAQYDEAIYQSMTSVDQMMMYNQQQIDYTNTQITDAINRYVQDPQIQAAYNYCLQTSGMCGTLEWYAYNYVATNGFTDGGAWMRQTQRMDANLQNGWQDYQNVQRGSADAMQDWRDSYYRTQEEAGKIITGESTYINSYTGTQEDLPYGWQPQTYNTHNGQTYYVDVTGQYYMLDPNNSGWMYPLTPWQPGQ